jgi:hypothetical protein
MHAAMHTSLVYFQVFLLKNLVEPRCPSHSVHTSLLTFFNLPPVKFRIAVIVYVVASCMITNLVEIMYNI